MTVHICYPEDLVAEGIDLEISKCIICCKETKQRAGYVGIFCPNCKNIITGDEWVGDIARYRREILQLTKKQIGNLVGKSKHTIHSYEWRKCPEWYLDKLEELMLNKK